MQGREGEDRNSDYSSASPVACSLLAAPFLPVETSQNRCFAGQTAASQRTFT